MVDTHKTLALSAYRQAFEALLYCLSLLGFTMPHKPHLHALGTIVLHMSAIYKYGIFASTWSCQILAYDADKNNLVYLVCTSANRFFSGIKLYWMGFS